MIAKKGKTNYNKTMKVKKTAKSTLNKKAEIKKKSVEPMVKVLNLNVNPENPRNNIIPPINYGQSTSSGVDINESNALTLAAVWGCVRTLSESVASVSVSM